MADRARTFAELAAGDGTPVTFTCECCGHVETFESPQAAFESPQAAFEANWDAPPYFTVATICGGCFSAFFVLGRSAECPHHRRAL